MSYLNDGHMKRLAKDLLTFVGGLRQCARSYKCVLP